MTMQSPFAKSGGLLWLQPQRPGLIVQLDELYFLISGPVHLLVHVQG